MRVTCHFSVCMASNWPYDASITSTLIGLLVIHNGCSLFTGRRRVQLCGEFGKLSLKQIFVLPCALESSYWRRGIHMWWPQYGRLFVEQYYIIIISTYLLLTPLCGNAKPNWIRVVDSFIPTLDWLFWHCVWFTGSLCLLQDLILGITAFWRRILGTRRWLDC